MKNKYTFQFNTNGQGQVSGFRDERDVATISKSLRGQVLGAFSRCGICGAGRNAYEHRPWFSVNKHAFKPMLTKKSAAPFYAKVEAVAKRIVKEYAKAREQNERQYAREQAARKAANTRRENAEAARREAGDRVTIGRFVVERKGQRITIEAGHPYYTRMTLTPATAKRLAAFMVGK